MVDTYIIDEMVFGQFCYLYKITFYILKYWIYILNGQFLLIWQIISFYLFLQNLKIIFQFRNNFE